MLDEEVGQPAIRQRLSVSSAEAEQRLVPSRVHHHRQQSFSQSTSESIVVIRRLPEA